MLDSNNRQLANEKTESKVTLGKPKSKKFGRRRNQGRNKESSKSLSDINTVAAEKGSLRNIEVERVRRIELSPLKNPSIHMAPGKDGSYLEALKSLKRIATISKRL